MRLTCPLCGERDLREFSYTGSADYLNRPDHDSDIAALDAHLHLRDNPAGDTKDLWYHGPCGTWILCHRNTLTHLVHSTELASGASV